MLVAFQTFSKNRGDICQVKVHHRYQQHWRQIFATETAGVVDTGGKFATGVNDAGKKYATASESGGK